MSDAAKPLRRLVADTLDDFGAILETARTNNRTVCADLRAERALDAASILRAAIWFDHTRGMLDAFRRPIPDQLDETSGMLADRLLAGEAIGEAPAAPGAAPATAGDPDRHLSRDRLVAIVVHLREVEALRADLLRAMVDRLNTLSVGSDVLAVLQDWLARSNVATAASGTFIQAIRGGHESDAASALARFHHDPAFGDRGSTQ